MSHYTWLFFKLFKIFSYNHSPQNLSTKPSFGSCRWFSLMYLVQTRAQEEECKVQYKSPLNWWRAVSIASGVVAGRFRQRSSQTFRSLSRMRGNGKGLSQHLCLSVGSTVRSCGVEGVWFLGEGELPPQGDEVPFQGKIWKPKGSLEVFKETLISSNWQADEVENLFVWEVEPQREDWLPSKPEWALLPRLRT